MDIDPDLIAALQILDDEITDDEEENPGEDDQERENEEEHEDEREQGAIKSGTTRGMISVLRLRMPRLLMTGLVSGHRKGWWKVG